jgi:hypothetical protein
MTKLTTKEIEALKGIVDSDFRDGNHPVGRAVWTWSANPFPSKRTFSGVVASLNSKGFTSSTDEGEDSTIVMTAAGWEALKAIEPEYCAKFEGSA